MEALLSGAVTGNYNELSMLIQEKGTKSPQQFSQSKIDCKFP
jgi:hypothetical protein